MPAGQPTKYDPDKVNPVVYELCKFGKTEVEIAEALGISVRTISNWKKAHPEFLQAVKEGKEIADSQVERSLFERATGYVCDDVHVSNYMGEITVTPLKKHYPPDTTAMIFWLKNRKPAEWRDKTESTVSVNAVPLSELSFEQKLAALRASAAPDNAAAPE